jgi:SpoIID/LytB domain protein
LFTEALFRDRDKLVAEQRSWHERGVATRLRSIGALYGVAGKVIDNRRYQLVTDSTMDAEAASALQGQILRRFGIRTTTVEELDEKPAGVLEISDASGSAIALGQDLAVAESVDGAGFDVRQVEYNVGYPSHGVEDRSFRGALQFAADRNGKLAIVNLVSLEELAMGVVPSEIFPRAHPEALKAQAVTARAEVLAKIGLRHLTDPYLLCGEQHCSVYKGLSGESPATNTAVEATRGQGLFSSSGELVDAVYSAVCGGFTEDNDMVWGTPPDPSLRGRPDVLGTSSIPVPRESLSAFLKASIPAACRLSSWAQPGKFRWERRFTSEEMDGLAAPLKLGRVRAIVVTERGISGRARVVTVAGEDSATQLRGELNIRKFFKMLNSSMFEVTPERNASGATIGWLFRGGGWGHGVGMCQTGAIGRAEAGQDYREILRFYYSGAEVVPIY